MKVRVSISWIASVVALCVALPGLAASRVEWTLNEGWSGTITPEKGASRSLESINLPHNWDDYHGYRQHFHGCLHGSAVYRRAFKATVKPGDRQFLVFEGAGSYLTVKVNGKELCRHLAAGRVTQTIEMTGAVRTGKNDLEVLCEHPSDIRDMPWVCGGCDICGCE